MKPKTAIVPRWECPEKKRLRLDIRRMEWTLLHRRLDRREREQTELLLADAKTRLYDQRRANP